MLVMTVDDGATAVAAARGLSAELSARALECERLGTLAPDLVDEMERAGLFRLALPRALGGLELEPAAVIETIEELCRADGSAGWTTLIGNCTSFFAWFEPSVARDLLSSTDGVTAASV